MIGKRLGRYEIVAKLGAGGMGAVWRARDTLLERDVALKTLTEETAEMASVRARFLREAKAASHLHHPGIATVYDAGEAEDLLYITFQLVEGQTIRERLAEGPVPVDEALRIAAEAAEALHFAHEHGVLHRDITSRNLMLDASGRVVIVDFGLALDLERTRLTGRPAQMGTAGYMAPETIRGEDADVQTDLYALGAVLYELLVGQVPFRGSRLEQVLYATVQEDPEPPSVTRPEISAELDALVLSLLAKDRAQRPVSAAGVARTLRDMSAASTSDDFATIPLSVSRTRDTTQQPGRVPRRRFLRGALALGALTPVAVLAIRTWLGLGGSGRAPRLLAVLPLRNLTPEDEGRTDWLVEAVNSNLVDRLTNQPRLQMTPWVTSFRYDPMSKGLAEIASELGVDVMLTGNLRLIADELIVSLALVDHTGQSQFWSQEFRGRYDELFALQREMATGVTFGLFGDEASGTGDAAPDPAGSVEAYELYTRGVRALRQGTRAGSDEAFRLFEDALSRDPELADALAGLGAIHSERYFLGREGGNRNLQIARGYFDRALEKDPENAAAFQGLLTLDWMNSDLLRVLQRTQDARWSQGEDLDDLAIRGRAYFLGGMPDRAIGLFQRILERDPANEGAWWFLPPAHAFAGEFSECLDSSDEYLRRFGRDPEIRLWRAVALSELDRHRRAANEARVSMREWGDEGRARAAFWCGLVHRNAGDLETAGSLWRDGVSWGEDRLREYPDNFRLGGLVSGLYYLLGEREQGDRVRATQSNEKGESGPGIADRYIVGLAAISPKAAILEFRALLPRWGWPIMMTNMLRFIAGDDFVDSEEFQAFLAEARQVDTQARRRFSF